MSTILKAKARKVAAAEKPGLKAVISLIKKYRLSLSDIRAAALKSSTTRSKKKVKIWLDRIQVKMSTAERFQASVAE